MIRAALAPDTFKLTLDASGAYKPFADEPLRLSAAKGTQAAFQLLLTADEPWALNVGASAWCSQRGELLTVRVEAPPDVMLRIEGMHLDDDGCRRADALLHQEVTEQAANEPCAVYCEVFADEPGERTVTLRLFASRLFGDETPAGELTARVKVFPVTLPKPGEGRFYLDLWQHPSNLARKYEVPLWSDAHFSLLEPFLRSLVDLGQRAVTLVVSEAPWSGQSCFNESTPGNLFEYSMIPLRKTREGKLSPDFRPMQRYIDLCAKVGIRDELSVYGLMNIWCVEGTSYNRVAPDDPDALRVRYLDESDGRYKYLRTEAELEEYIASIGAYFRESGQMERVRVAADEPADIERYRRSMERLKRIEPAFRFKAAINHPEFIGEYGEEIFDFVPYIGGLLSHFDQLREYRLAMPEKRFLWYVCCGPAAPNTFLRSDLCETLFLGVFTSWCRLEGFLRWSYMTWNDFPRADIRYGHFPAGDLCLVYPSPSGEPVLTLRWKALRRAIRLYELLERLRAERGEDAADALLCGFFGGRTCAQVLDAVSRGEVCRDPARYENLQETLLEMLSEPLC